MSQLLESIWIKDRRVRNIAFHQKRFLESMKAVFNVNSNRVLRSMISTKDIPDGDVKCRLIYDKSHVEVQYLAYSRKKINAAKLVYSNDVQYEYKYLLRPQLDTLFKQKEQADEIIIVKNGLITDAYNYNLVFQNSSGFYTPVKPLLYGTMRQNLISKHLIMAKDISPDQLQSYERIHFINALNPLHSLTIGVSQLS